MLPVKHYLPLCQHSSYTASSIPIIPNMAYPDYESRVIAAVVAGTLLPRWLDLPPVSAAIVSGLLGAAMFMLVERLIRRER
jgi:hypothetical protein